jgi:hypothetical protein
MRANREDVNKNFAALNSDDDSNASLAVLVSTNPSACGKVADDDDDDDDDDVVLL